MSRAALNTAFEGIRERKLTAAASLVLLVLANRHNQETGRCDPSLAMIAEDAGLSERAVRNGLRQLEKEKLISTIHRTVRTGKGKRNLRNRYRIRRGAKSAGTMGHKLPGKREYTLSAFDDLAMLVEGDDV